MVFGTQHQPDANCQHRMLLSNFDVCMKTEHVAKVLCVQTMHTCGTRSHAHVHLLMDVARRFTSHTSRIDRINFDHLSWLLQQN